MNKLGRFRITTEESQQFARLSGDFNPLHLDPIAARRTQFGGTLIHGVFGTLRALDILLEGGDGPVALQHLRVKFSKPVSQGTDIDVCEIPGHSDRHLELFTDDVRCQIIDVAFTENPEGTPPGAEVATHPVSNICHEPGITDCDGLESSVHLRLPEAEPGELFANVSRRLPPGQLASILACTEIVGMRCPGLHSVFATLDLQFPGPADGATSSLNYRVVSTDPRIDRVLIAVENAVTQGTMEAFFRPKPVRQTPFSAVCKRVGNNEFERQSALVIGGSRGLGEVIAKVLAAGGAKLMLTYASGAEDTRRIADEIAATRDRPVLSRYDVLKPSHGPQFRAFLAGTTHIYYLASPLIHKGDPRRRDEALLERYRRFYVDGLATLLDQLRAHREHPTQLSVFIPSSVFLEGDTRGFGEYVEAKKAAESFARQYALDNPDTHFHAPRLPRLHTDQTSGVRGLDADDTLKVVIDTLRALYGRSARPTRD